MSNSTAGMIVAIVAACGLAQTSIADTIALKSSVRLNSGASVVKLSDLADLNGAEALALAELPIAMVKDASTLMEIPLRDVRAKLEEAHINWGHINLSGRAVTVRPGRAGDAAPPLAMMPASVGMSDNQRDEPRSRTQQRAADVLDSPTLRGTITNLIVSNLHVDAADLRLGFDHADDAFLDTSTQTTRFEVQPLGSFASDRIDLTVRTWMDSKVQQSRTISIQPLIRIEAVVLRRDVQKDQTIAEADLQPSEQWLPPSQAGQTSTLVNAVGRVALKNMKTGEIVRLKNVRRDNLIKRGDLVIIRCLVGGVVISLQAEARDDGGEGDNIEFRKKGEKENFLATISSRGEAVIDLSKK